jgi:hypothetical protein
MSNFADFLKTLNLEVEVNTTSYVYFTPNDGTIHKISSANIPTEEYDIIEVAHDSVADIVNGTKSSQNFVVAYDTSAKHLVLKQLTYEDSLDTIDYKLQRLPVFKTFSDSRFSILESIYDGVEVCMWVPGVEYNKDSLVWYNNAVYKLLKDFISSKTFDDTNAAVFIEDVLVTDARSSNFLECKQKFQPIYKDIFVDVWYNKLSHLAGQHVWIDDTVYRIKQDQIAGTEFTVDNAELIENNVFLYNDKNKNLKFKYSVQLGDRVLDNNKLYLYTEEEISVSSTNKSIIFYASKTTGLLFDADTRLFTKFSIIERDNKNIAETEIVFDAPVEHVVSIDRVPSGQKILVGKTLFLTNEIERHNFDINIVQNNIKGLWEVYLSDQMIRSLDRINYFAEDILYFSVTAKHDPNILYRTIEFSLRDLLNERYRSYPFRYNWEFNKDDVSVYTSKFFDSYSHEILE